MRQRDIQQHLELPDLLAKVRAGSFVVEGPHEAVPLDEGFKKASLADIAKPYEFPVDAAPVGEVGATEGPEEARHDGERQYQTQDEDGVFGADVAVDAGGWPVVPDRDEGITDPNSDMEQSEPQSTLQAPTGKLMHEGELQSLRQEAYDEGFQAGKAAAESATEGQLSAAITRVEGLVQQLQHDDIIDLDELKTTMRHMVSRLASELAGYAIEEMPEQFMDRLETSLAQLSHVAGHREVRLNPDDHVFLLDMPASSALRDVQLLSDATLPRGHIRVRVGGAEIGDDVPQFEAS